MAMACVCIVYTHTMNNNSVMNDDNQQHPSDGAKQTNKKQFHDDSMEPKEKSNTTNDNTVPSLYTGINSVDFFTTNVSLHMALLASSADVQVSQYVKRERAVRVVCRLLLPSCDVRRSLVPSNLLLILLWCSDTHVLPFTEPPMSTV